MVWEVVSSPCFCPRFLCEALDSSLTHDSGDFLLLLQPEIALLHVVEEGEYLPVYEGLLDVRSFRYDSAKLRKGVATDAKRFRHNLIPPFTEAGDTLISLTN